MTKTALETSVRTITVRPGLTVGYRELGAGPPVLLLHGWPTSSYLWRRVMPAIARQNRVLALDLPGFGASTKPLDVRYDFALFEAAIDGFLAAAGVDDVAVAGHDLGGPIALHWAITRQSRLRRLALLNTLIYPEFSAAVRDFVAVLRTPAEADRVTSPDGLAEIMRLGVADPSTITSHVLAGVLAPFHDGEARRALAMAGYGLGVRGFAEIAAALPSLTAPVRVIYGERDNILPDVADTFARLARDLPNTDISALPECGHFLQEEAPHRVGELLARFFASTEDASSSSHDRNRGTQP